MKLGVLTALFLDRTLDEALVTVTTSGVTTVEIPVGGYFPTTHASAVDLMEDVGARRVLQSTLIRAGVEVSAFAVHGNPLHPRQAIAEAHTKDLIAAIRLASELEVGRVTLLAGLPGGAPGDQRPNWVTQPFPPESGETLAWQWDEVGEPFWHGVAGMADSAGVDLCFEMVPNDLVCSPLWLLELRRRLGTRICANLDPSHLFFLGVDPLVAIDALGPAIRHVHAKDARLNHRSIAGFMDPRPFREIGERGWSYRTIGYGHGEDFWRAFFDSLRLVGYDDVVSVEHEDLLLSADEGFERAIEFLRSVVPFRPQDDEGWWGV